MRTGLMMVLAILAIIVAVLQKTPAAFLSQGASDFVSGAAAGLTIGAAVAWYAGRAGNR